MDVSKVLDHGLFFMNYYDAGFTKPFSAMHLRFMYKPLLTASIQTIRLWAVFKSADIWYQIRKYMASKLSGE